MSTTTPPPEEVPDRELTDGGTADGGSHGLLASQEVAIDNVNASGGAAQTVTVTNRGKNGGTFTVVINAGFSAKISGRGLRSFAFGSTDSNVQWRVGPRGSVWPLQGFSAGGGTSPATTVSHDFASENITPTSNATFQMGGLGSALAMTPTKSGKVRVTIKLTLLSGTLSDQVECQLRFGTGSAPALHAAATGTSVSVMLQIIGPAGFQLDDSPSIVVTGLTLSTTYWFDLAISVANDATDAVLVGICSLEELGQ